MLNSFLQLQEAYISRAQQTDFLVCPVLDNTRNRILPLSQKGRDSPDLELLIQELALLSPDERGKGEDRNHLIFKTH